MKINRQNYEAYFLDYIEGNLNAEDAAEVLLFAEQNPDLAEELSGLENVAFEPASVEFGEKQLLKKSEPTLSSDELDLLMAKQIEGDLTAQEEKILAEYHIQYPIVSARQRAFAKTKLVADEILFDAKKELLIPATIDYSDIRNLLIGKVEDDLSLEQNNTLAGVLQQNQNLQTELAAYYRTKLKAAPVVFENKALLKQKEAARLVWIRYAGVAAAAAVVLMFWLLPNEIPVGNTAANRNNTLELDLAVKESAQQDELPKDQSIATTDQTLHHQSTVVEKAALVDNENSLQRQKSMLIPDRMDRMGFVPSKLELPATELAIAPSFPDMNSILNSADNSDHQAMASVNSNNQFMTISSFFEDKVKGELWGNADYPKDNYTLALAQKAADKVLGRRESKLEMQRVNTDEEKSFRLRIGKFEFLRKR